MEKCQMSMHSAKKSISDPVLINREDLVSLGIKVSNSSLLRWEAAGRFPRRIRMAGTSVAWLKAEVDAWFEARAEERRRHVYAEF